jgi:predicted secreted hydrolase
MRSKWLALLLLTVTCATAQDYHIAQPGYTFAFPRDYFNHEDYQTEWWYYTGNVKAADGHRFGFELTFFRQGVSRAAQQPPLVCARPVDGAHRAERYHRAALL